MITKEKRGGIKMKKSGIKAIAILVALAISFSVLPGMAAATEAGSDCWESVPFTVLETVVTRTFQDEGLCVTERDGSVFLTIVKGFNTSGYWLRVNKISRLSDSQYGVGLSIIRPDLHDKVLQVLTWIKTTIEIDRDDLRPNYNFQLLELRHPRLPRSPELPRFPSLLRLRRFPMPSAIMPYLFFL